ncbi:hypothetical protein HUO09_17775 [Vibrio sp. Y2-5]|uniref:hypothetical protein n=1 Tax=Vibrio sp. Y2-5 TaxID=2743977 RepID=UPI0016618394|nr:hypothetical protein [Vibrio sp. Y2-5]MBD0788208.1 hypothetical protein [Vibrio sp. Y2-5]
MTGIWLSIKGGTVKKESIVLDGSFEYNLEFILNEHKSLTVLQSSKHWLLLGNNANKPVRLLLSNQ